MGDEVEAGPEAAFEIIAVRTPPLSSPADEREVYTGDYMFHTVLAYGVKDGQVWLRGIHSTTHEVGEAARILERYRPWDEWKRFALTLMATDQAAVSGGTWEDVSRANYAALNVPIRRTRARVTDTTLKDVARVYRRAWESGEAPTRAVEKHFYKSHSTAARWVGMARERGFLGKADGRRGGEVSHDQEGEASD
jgi:hypothetical protein